MITTEQKIFAILAHIGYLLGGVSMVIVPLIILLWKKEDCFISFHAKQALIAQFTLTLAALVTGSLIFLLIGFLLLPALFILYIIFFFTSIFAAYAAFNGNYYEYPLIRGIVARF